MGGVGRRRGPEEGGGGWRSGAGMRRAALGRREEGEEAADWEWDLGLKAKKKAPWGKKGAAGKKRARPKKLFPSVFVSIHAGLHFVSRVLWKTLGKVNFTECCLLIPSVL